MNSRAASGLTFRKGEPRGLDAEQPSLNGARPRSSITVELQAPLVEGYVDWLCARLATLPRGAETLLVCEVASITHPDMGTVDALARLQLTATRAGWRMRVRNASTAMQELLDLAGLEDVILLEE